METSKVGFVVANSYYMCTDVYINRLFADRLCRFCVLQFRFHIDLDFLNCVCAFVNRQQERPTFISVLVFVQTQS